jgi:thiamine pyrophosphokinase
MKKEKIIVIVANGETTQSDRSGEAIHNASTIIAADGGADNCLETGIIPDYILGDFDSITEKGRTSFPADRYIHIADQDTTDMEKAIRFAMSLHPDRIRILSALGRRMDHTAANLLLLAEVNKQVPVELYDNHGKMAILNPGTYTLPSFPGKPVSFFSINPIRHLTLSGFMYPLKDRNYDSFFIGISNQCGEGPCTVSFSEGILYMYELLE